MSIYSEMLNRIKQVGVKNALSENTSEEFFCQLSDLRRNLLAWYDFKEESDILEIGGECGSITSLLCDKAKTVISFEPNKEKAEINRFVNIEKDNLKIISDSLDSIKDSFDYVIIVGTLEIAPSFIDGDDPFKSLLLFAKNHLNEGGTILLATDNRIGARCFAGYPETHLNTYFTGINDYRGINNVRTFSKNELKDLYISAGLFNKAFYYPYPDYKYPTEIFTDRTINSSLYGRPYPNYSERYAEIIDENKLLQDYAKEGVADTFANSFLVELTSDHSNKKKIDVEYIKLSIDRKENFQIYTKIWNDGTNKKVSKYAINQNGITHIDKMREIKYEGKGFGILKNRSRKSGILTYPFLSQTSLDKKAYELIQKKDGDSVIKLFDLVKSTFLSDGILKEMNPCNDTAFIEVFGKNGQEVRSYNCVKSTCFDLILDNIFDKDNKLVIIDYEWFFDFYIPSEYLMWRSINELYYKYPELYNILDRTELLERYDVSIEDEEQFRKWEHSFVNHYVGGNRYSNNEKEKINVDVTYEAKESFEKVYPTSTLYLDAGNGFSEDTKYVLPVTTDDKGYFELEYSINTESSVSLVKWDPVSTYCICDKVQFCIDGEYFDPIFINGINNKGKDIFISNDPYYIFAAHRKGINTIKISGYLKQIEKEDYYNTAEGLIEKIKKDFEDDRVVLENHKKIIEDDNKTIDMLSNEIKEYENKSILTSRELNAYEAYLSTIRNSKIWNVYRIKRGAKKFAKKLIGRSSHLVGDNDDNIKFDIETFCYYDNILSLSGWIFSPANMITNLQVVIKQGDDVIYAPLNINNRREDVKIAYNNPSAYDSGFEEKYILRFSGKADVFLNASVNDKVYSIRVGSVCGNNYVDEMVFSRFEEIKDGESLIGLQSIEKDDKEGYSFSDTIDIIIPVYNGVDYLEKLLEDIRKTTVNTHIIIIDDNSSDDYILPMLFEYRKKYDNVELICNEENLGFVKSVNKGLAVSTNHVVLVNTDVELPDGWLERLMYPIVTRTDVASTTPFANSATIFSFPNFGENNPIYKGMTVDDIDGYFRAYKPRYTVVPTGMGFLMGMNKNVIKEIGILDEETFGKGFGEENDWCQRAAKKHYYNVHVENLFAYHKHGGSFVSEEKQKLLDENSKKLEEKHPNYFSDVARFCEINPLDTFRNIIKLNIDKDADDKSVILAFNHDLGGGADAYLKQKIVERTNNNSVVLEVRYKVYDGDYELLIHNDKVSSVRLASFVDVLSILNTISIDEIYINELVTYPKLFDTLDMIVDFSQQKSSKLVMLMHDYFAVSPTINLVSVQDYKYSYDGESFACDEYYYRDGFESQYECPSIEEWRANWNLFLTKCAEVRAFSNSTIEILNGVYPELNNISLVPHKVEYMIPVKRKRKLTKTLNIGLLGVLSRHKGKDIVSMLINNAKTEDKNIRFILIGTNDPGDPDPLEENDYFKICGKYYVEDLPRLVLENDIDIFLIPSIWPETFSYTTEEIIKMNIPVACFNYGAPAERVKKYEKGLVIDSNQPGGILNSLEQFADTLDVFGEMRDESRKVLCIAEYISFSSRYRMDHFQEELILEGIESRYISAENLDELTDEELSEYSHIFIYRCRYKDKLIPFIQRIKDKKPIIYDIDDYIYDYGKIKELSFLNDSDYDNFEEYSKQIRECMSHSDTITTSTETLANVIKTDFPDKKVIVNRNVASMAMQILSNKAILSHEKHNGIVMGYFSGSKTHNDDFKLIEDHIVSVMESNPDAKLLLVGCIEASEKFNNVRNRIKHIDFVDWRELPQLLRSVDINLMPLVDSFFNCCKSENKWLEASLVRRITVASYNDELNYIATNEDNIVFCKEDDWNNLLRAARRKIITQNAFDYVTKNKVTYSISHTVLESVFDEC